MLIDLFRNGLSFELVISLGVRLLFILLLLPIHEYAHALIAYKLGDHTARLSGRLTLNPLAHLDLLGSLMMLFAGFGYAKPVPVNMNNFPPRKRKSYMALVAFAGPMSNIIMAFLALIIKSALISSGIAYTNSFVGNVTVIIQLIAQLNIGLAVFNLLPVPPLDGSRILNVALPDKYYYTVMKYERYITLGVFFLIVSGILDTPLSFLTSIITAALSLLANLPFAFLGN